MNEDVNLLLNYIETEVLSGKKTLFNNGVTVNGEAILDLITRVRRAFGAFMGEDILDNARLQAKQLVAFAEQRRAQLLDENILMAEAKALAEKTVNDALKQRGQIEEGMKTNVANMLTGVRKVLTDAERDIDVTIEKFRSSNRN